MNRQGVFITFMVFLIVVSILTVHDVSRGMDFKKEKGFINEAAFNNINNAFNNMYEEVVSLNKEGAAKDVQQRPMPFQYDFNKKSIILSQNLPVRQATLEAYIDALNIYSIFANKGEEITDLNITTSAAQDSRWGASGFPDLNYVILPQCLLYDVNSCCLDVNLMSLQELGAGEMGCVAGFDYLDFNVVDVNILLDSRSCSTGSIGGNLAGKTQAFDPAETKPYFRIEVNETNAECPGTGCFITDSSGKEKIYGHFDPESFAPAEAIDSLMISCNAQNWVRVKLGKQSADDSFPFVAYNWLSSQPVEIDLNIAFDQRVELFYFSGFSINVEKENFNIKRSS